MELAWGPSVIRDDFFPRAREHPWRAHDPCCTYITTNPQSPPLRGAFTNGGLIQLAPSAGRAFSRVSTVSILNSIVRRWDTSRSVRGPFLAGFSTQAQTQWFARAAAGQNFRISCNSQGKGSQGCDKRLAQGMIGEG